MARNKRDITLTDEYRRDRGKTFRLTEMPASQAEEWAYRCFLGFMNSGIEVPEDVRAQGIAGIASLGFKALMGIQWETAKPLLDEMWQCVSVVPNPQTHADLTRPPVEEDVEEVSTRAFLRAEVYALHVGFSISDSLSKLAALIQEALASSLNTETSRDLSPPLSLPGSPA